HVAAARVEQPLRDVQPAAGPEGQLDLPAAVTVLACVPLRVLGVGAQVSEPLGHRLPEPRARRGVALPPDGRVLRLLGHVGPLSQHRSLEPADSLDRDPRRVCDLLDRLPGTNSGLDLLGPQGILHFDLVRGEPGELAFGDRPQPVVDGQHETPAPPRNGEDGVTAVFAYRDEAQFLHGRPFPSRACPGGLRRTWSGTGLPARGCRSRGYLASTWPGLSRVRPGIRPPGPISAGGSLVWSAGCRDSRAGHQFHRPSSTTVEGTSTVRTTNVSIRTPRARPTPPSRIWLPPEP